MTTIAKCHEFAEANGFEIEDWGDNINIVYPQRKRAIDSHERVLGFEYGRAGAWRLVMQEMKEMLKYQIDCTDAECEWCNS